MVFLEMVGVFALCFIVLFGVLTGVIQLAVRLDRRDQKRA